MKAKRGTGKQKVIYRTTFGKEMTEKRLERIVTTQVLLGAINERTLWRVMIQKQLVHSVESKCKLRKLRQ